MNPLYFASAAHWRKWLDKHHDTEPELWVGFYKRSSGEPSPTWPEAVDQAPHLGLEVGDHHLSFVAAQRSRVGEVLLGVAQHSRKRGAPRHPVGLEDRELFRSRVAVGLGVDIHVELPRRDGWLGRRRLRRGALALVSHDHRRRRGV